MPIGIALSAMSMTPCRKRFSSSLRLRALRTVAAFPRWLFTIAQQECRRLERHVFRLDALDEARMEEWLATGPDEVLPVDLVCARESLPAHDREVVLVRDFAGLTIRALAARLALSAIAVKGRLHRARACAGISDRVVATLGNLPVLAMAGSSTQERRAHVVEAQAAGFQRPAGYHRRIAGGGDHPCATGGRADGGGVSLSLSADDRVRGQ